MTNRTGQIPDQVYKTTLKANAQDVWDAITNPEFTRQYWFDRENRSDWKEGSAWNHVNKEGKSDVTGEVLESKPPHKLVISWRDPGDAVDVSRVTFQIEEKGNTVELTVIHGNFIDGSEMSTHVSKGWPAVLANLKRFVEGSAEPMQAFNPDCNCA